MEALWTRIDFLRVVERIAFGACTQRSPCNTPCRGPLLTTGDEELHAGMLTLLQKHAPTAVLDRHFAAYLQSAIDACRRRVPLLPEPRPFRASKFF